LDDYANLNKLYMSEAYKSFVGADELAVLQKRFSVRKFVGRWEQVMTSLSTQLMGTGMWFSSINAIYELTADGRIRLTNSAFNQKFQQTYIQGVSDERDGIATCRTVQFDNLPFSGDYWIIYANKRCDTIIVSAPLIVLGQCVTENLGLYVLTKNRESFWHDKMLVSEIQEQLDKYGFNSFYNRAIFSGESMPIRNPLAGVVSGRWVVL
jgi:lipocalin